MPLNKLSLQFNNRFMLRDQAYSSLRDAIISGLLEPGERLVEQQIADLLGLSRNPVREAFRRLEQEGYLVMTRTGVQVRGVSFRELHDLYAVRVRLEGMASAWLAERASDEDVARLRKLIDDMYRLLEKGDEHELTQASFDFHVQVYSMLDNKFLMEVLTNLTDQLRRYRSLQFKIPHRGKASVDEDHQVVEAIARHDAEAADRLAQGHVNRLWAHAQAIAREPSADSDSPMNRAELSMGQPTD